MKTSAYYRLRNKNKIEGFAKEENGITYFKGYNEFSWHKTPLQFDTIDIGIEVLDKRNRRLFTNDIVVYKVSTKPFLRTGSVVYESNRKEFGIIDQHSFHFTPFFIDNLNLFEKDKLEIISHLFTRKEKTK
ncbi:hypothetical protein [Empedobacter tilapiae]|uniref:YopX protein domain-containing protein n=1 Tax=Empedobacter tilapiae TaxID=2491114 RepID=A0A4Z1B5P6_9FLAO|nr:hypothetical protein [Empedobacter tilapiae]TGN26306.1 hypothetical protein E4J94_10760 [Empedobacter tilapiae]